MRSGPEAYARGDAPVPGALATALVGGAVIAPPASAVLTAREIRIGDHPGFVRVVVDFTGGRIETGEVVATDPNPFADGFVRLPLTRAGVRTTADPVRDEGVFARIAQGSGKRQLAVDERQLRWAGEAGDRPRGLPIVAVIDLRPTKATIDPRGPRSRP